MAITYVNPSSNKQKPGTVRTIVPSQRPGGKSRTFEGKRIVRKSKTGELIISGEPLPASQRSSTSQSSRNTNPKSINENTPKQSLASRTLTANLPTTSPEIVFGLVTSKQYAQRENLPYYQSGNFNPDLKNPPRVRDGSYFVGFTKKQARTSFEVETRREQRLREKVASELPPILLEKDVNLGQKFLFGQDKAYALNPERGTYFKYKKTTFKLLGDEKFKQSDEDFYFFLGSKNQPVNKIIKDDQAYFKDPRNTLQIIGDDYGVRKAFQSNLDIARERKQRFGESDIDINSKSILQEKRSSQFNVGLIAGGGLGLFESGISSGVINPSRFTTPKTSFKSRSYAQIDPVDPYQVNVLKGKGFDVNNKISLRFPKQVRLEGTFPDKAGSVNIDYTTGKVQVFKGSGFGATKVLEYVNPNIRPKVSRVTTQEIFRRNLFKDKKGQSQFGLSRQIFKDESFSDFRKGYGKQFQDIAPELEYPKTGFELFESTSGKQFQGGFRVPKFNAYPVLGIGTSSKSQSRLDYLQNNRFKNDFLFETKPKVNQKSFIDQSSNFDFISGQDTKTNQIPISIPKQDTFQDFSFTPRTKQPSPTIKFPDFVVPPIGLPSFSFGGGLASKRKKKKPKGRQARKTTPQFSAVVFGLRGKAKKRNKYFSGFEFRGL